MVMGTANSQCRVLFALCSGLLAVQARRLAALTLAVLLITASASPQSPARAASAPSAPPRAAAPETPPPQPNRERAQHAYRAGQRAEQSGDWKAAYTAYSDAITYAPANREYPLLREHARFQLVQRLTDLAERQFLAGDAAGAREQLMRALEIDPNYVVARERLAAPKYTDRRQIDIGTGQATDRSPVVDVPQLRNVAYSAPYLHDGSARSLEEIWTVFNPKDTHGVSNDLTKDELNDLIEYLKTL